jgi:2-phospho-L-lactate guanylyltransferase
MIAAVIPVKHLGEAKSRLAPRLSRAQRESLVLRLLDRVVGAVRETGQVSHIAVATPDAEVAEAAGAMHLPDVGSLNGTLSAAARWAVDIGAHGLLILPCDLPMITPDDIVSILESGAGIGIAPTHDGGTGALYLRPPGCIPPQFGPDSYARHIASARQRRLTVRDVHREGFRFDLDTVVDLERFSDVLLTG